MTPRPDEPAIIWMRDAALFAAACAIQTPADAPIAPRAPWPAAAGGWEALVRRARPLGLAPAAWVAAAAAAAELHPDAAVAFSILAENERLLLPTPVVFARIAVAGLGMEFDAALAAALTVSPAVERVEPSGYSVPAAQAGLRLTRQRLARLFGSAEAAAGEDVPAAHAPIFARPARAAALIMAEDGAVWIRARARRIARQLALDIATAHPTRRATFVAARPDEPAPELPDGGGLPVLDLFDLDRPPRLATSHVPFVIIAPERFEHPGFRAVDAPPLAAAAAAAVWTLARLPEADRARLAGRFRVTVPELRAAETEAATLMVLRQAPNGPTPQPDAAMLARAIRAAGARRMGPFVNLVESDVTLDDLVATRTMRSQLDDAVAWRRNDARVWGEMGLPTDAADARGLALLFSGPPGGGKTFAARCLANALGINLYRVDLSQVVSKYIGETEKRLAQIFDEAEAGHGVLFFDEADAVFGKRSEVKDAHDRYANIEIGFLLQRIESFGGVMVLATNLRANLDPAFVRRLHFIVDFPMPGRAERAELWARNLPAPAWRAPDLDIAALAERFRLSGGNIRNAAVAAAHLAAEEHGPLAMRHLARALYRELEKSGLPRGEAELGDLFQQLERAL